MELETSSALGTPVANSRACANCARAKAKCVSDPTGGTKCERCHRLKKECQPSVAIRKSSTFKRTSTKTARLEAKLDGIVSLLKSATQSNLVVADNIATSSTTTGIQPSLNSSQSLITDLEDVINHGPHPTHLVSQHEEQQNEFLAMDGVRLHSSIPTPTESYQSPASVTTTDHSPESSLNRGFKLSFKVADESLMMFQSQMAKRFPFLHVPSAFTAQELRLERPFLWLCIMTVSSRSSAQQMALGREVRQTLGQKVIVEGERSLDLFLGVLTYAAWGQYQDHHKPIVTNLIQLAIALLADLGLDKPLPKETTFMMLEYDARGCPKSSKPTTRTMEERRALLGCFVVSSVISSFFQRIDALRWTAYCDECLRMLSEHEEYPTDALLIQIVRSQLIIERLAEAPCYNGVFDEAGSSRAPLVFYLKAQQVQLQDFKRNVPIELQGDETLLFHLYSIEICIHEIALSKPRSCSNGPEAQWLDSLYVCLQATKNWFDLFFSLSPALCIGFSMSLFTQLAHCFIVLYRLSTFDDPDWDRGLVRDTLDLSLVLDQIVKKLAQVKAAAGLDSGSLENIDIFSVTSQRISSIKTWWDAKVVTALTGPGATDLDKTLGDISLDFSDDAWLKSILGFEDFQFEPYMQ